jgi:hypothetical protein
LKRDLSRPSSTVRTDADHESQQETSNRTEQMTDTSTSPLEIMSVEVNGSSDSKVDRTPSTSFSSAQEQTSEDNTFEPKRKATSKECRHLSICSKTNKDIRTHRLRQQKSVSFATSILRNDHTTHRYSIGNEQKLLDKAHQVADRILLASLDQTAAAGTSVSSVSNDDEQDFQRDFYQTIRPRRFSIGNSKDLMYQNLSAEIVAYVLKHALRALEEEDNDEQARSSIEQAKQTTDNEHHQSMDLK